MTGISLLHSPSRESPFRRSFFLTRTPYVPVALGLVLLAASGLKGHELATEPLAEKDLWTSRWFLIGVVEFELALGLWLIVGYRPGQARLAALVAFGTFSLFSLSRALGGEASCGCFGKAPVSPWYTLGFNLIAVVTLLCWRPVVAREAVARAPGLRFLAIVLLFLLVGIPAGIATATYRPGSVTPEGDILGNGSIVLLEPEKWVGQRFPLLKYIDVGDELAHGQWVVLLYHHDCPKCKEVLPHYEQTALVMVNNPKAPRIAFIEVPPYGDPDPFLIPKNTPCKVGALRDVNNWFVTTPATLYVAEGVVLPVAEGEAWLRNYNYPLQRGLRHLPR